VYFSISIGESSFSGRLVAWFARAVAHIYGKDREVRSIPQVAVNIGYALEGRALFMIAASMYVQWSESKEIRWKHTTLHHWSRDVPLRWPSLIWTAGGYPKDRI
jgi:hypothetical protein